jgi:hypothetical protein
MNPTRLSQKDHAAIEAGSAAFNAHWRPGPLAPPFNIGDTIQATSQPSVSSELLDRFRKSPGSSCKTSGLYSFGGRFVQPFSQRIAYTERSSM